MYTSADFQKAFEDYMQYNRDLKAGMKPMDGILGVLGFGHKPGHDQGHAEFLQEMKSAIDQVCARQPDPDTADGIIDVIFQAKHVYAEEKLSPYIYTAVEGFTTELIPFLSEAKAQEIYQQVLHTPMKLRTPVRKKLLSAFQSRVQGDC